MQTRALLWAFLALFSSTGSVLFAQSDDHALRIKTVEHGLVTSLSISISKPYHSRRMEPKVNSAVPPDAGALTKHAGTYHLVTSSPLATDPDQFFPLTADLPDLIAKKVR